MRIITVTCPDCGTIVAANVLEAHREMKCPRLDCENVLRFVDVPEAEQSHFLEHRDAYQI